MTTKFSVRIDARGASASVFVGTTDQAGKYQPRAYYATEAEAAAVIDNMMEGQPWHARSTFTIVERQVRDEVTA